MTTTVELHKRLVLVPDTSRTQPRNTHDCYFFTPLWTGERTKYVVGYDIAQIGDSWSDEGPKVNLDTLSIETADGVEFELNEIEKKIVASYIETRLYKCREYWDDFDEENEGHDGPITNVVMPSEGVAS